MIAKIKELENKLDSIKKELAELKAQPTELVKSWEDAFNLRGFYINNSAGVKEHQMDSKEPSHKKVFRLEAQAKSALAFAQLSHIVADANGDWVANQEDINQRKFFVVDEENKLVPGYCCTGFPFLLMKSSEIRDACLEKHRTLWEDFWMISK